MKKPCTRCELNPIHSHGLCTVCLKYRERNGVDRPYTLIEAVAKRRKGARWCKVCGHPDVYLKQRCEPCYNHYWRTGKERPRWQWDEDFCCETCGFPKKAATRNKSGGLRFIADRCLACYNYLKKYNRERPEAYWGAGLHGFCDCGQAANDIFDKLPMCSRCLADAKLGAFTPLPLRGR